MVWVSDRAGSHISFLLSIAIVLSWLVAGPIFNYSDSWQLFINTFTTVSTFMMVFCIQYSQNKDTKEIKDRLKYLLDKQLEKIKDEISS